MEQNTAAEKDERSTDLRNRFRTPYRVLIAFLAFLASDMGLRAGGFPWLYRAVSRVPVKQNTEDHPELIQQLCSAADKAATYYFRNVKCLQRSAVTTWLLRVHGIPAEMVIGCRKVPFAAHAWVEVRNEIVNDQGRASRTFAVIARL